MWLVLNAIITLTQNYQKVNYIIFVMLLIIGLWLISFEENYMTYNTDGVYLGIILCYVGFVITKNKLFICLKLLLGMILYFLISVVTDTEWIILFPLILDILQLSLIISVQ